MRIKIEKLVYGGAGMARTNTGVVFVPRTIPGELVEAEIVDRKKDYAHARLVEILEPSEDRRGPSCPNFETVGCCGWDHIAYERQRALKQEILFESLARLGKVELPEPIECIHGPEREYRLRASFHVRDRRLGFMKEGTNDVVAIDRCAALMPELNSFISVASETLTQPGLEGTDTVRAVVSPEKGEVAATFLRGRERARWTHRDPTTTVGGIEFRLNPDTFFQPNRFLLERFVSVVVNAAGAPDITLDLFCGSGFFSLPLAKLSSRLLGVDRRSIRTAQGNARRNRIANVEFIKASAWAFLANSDIRPDLVVLDPPRSGAGRNIVKRVAGLSPKRVVYVSCNPTTFAPEARLLLETGYALTSITFIDEFPNSHHIETVGLFERA